ncbi:uncharacterized protein LOC113315701 [Papaver somniferum]|uniref:uncharacterized protein LOC113315701 n=1 Tax=Papaver somniferum TaxID=3469 RepID=UPI000E6F4C1C|nr:uncharacterized protein LOC113315701 [Papaver somniferum]
MSREDYQPITVKFDGTNYNHWSFLMRSFLKGKSMWKYIDGKAKKPANGVVITDKGKDTGEETAESWEINNHKILTWLSNTVVTSISMQLTSFETAKDAWEFLSKREESRLVQLLMALRDDFETVRASILHRSPLPSVEAALSELITEETRKRIKPDIPAVFAVNSRANFNTHLNSQKTHRDFSQIQCYNCKKPGHLAKNCTVPSVQSGSQSSNTQTIQQGSSFPIQCNYCKEPGHTVGNCTSPTSRNMRERRKFNGTGYTSAPSSYAATSPSSYAAASTPNNLADIQEMLKKALSLGNNNSTAASTLSTSTSSFSNGSQDRKACWDRP